MQLPGIGEAVALSTCNRTELYVVANDPVEAEAAVLATLARRAGTRPTELLASIYADRNCDAARHLFRVVGGLAAIAARQLPITDVSVDVSGTLGGTPEHFTAFELTVSAPSADPEALAHVVALAERSCQVVTTMRLASEVRVRMTQRSPVDSVE